MCSSKWHIHVNAIPLSCKQNNAWVSYILNKTLHSRKMEVQSKHQNTWRRSSLRCSWKFLLLSLPLVTISNAIAVEMCTTLTLVFITCKGEIHNVLHYKLVNWPQVEKYVAFQVNYWSHESWFTFHKNWSSNLLRYWQFNVRQVSVIFLAKKPWCQCRYWFFLLSLLMPKKKIINTTRCWSCIFIAQNSQLAEYGKEQKLRHKKAEICIRTACCKYLKNRFLKSLMASNKSRFFRCF